MADTSSPWSFAQRFSFRFFSIFLLLNMFPFPANLYPDELFMDGLTYLIWKHPVQWIATYWVGLPGEVNTDITGSGDTTFHWILLGLMTFVSLMAAVVWSLLDRKRPNYAKAMGWLRVYTRYYLAYMLFIYGFVKIYHLQMPTPALYRLSEPFGKFSPMGVLWSFIGMSKAYSAFSGWVEVIGGALLLFRRTALLGALWSAAVMFNVFLLNMCYDVPVKIFSFFLLIACVFLVAPEIKRLFAFFVLKKTVEPWTEAPLFEQKKWRIAALTLKVSFIAWVLYTNISSCLEGQKEYGDAATPAPLSGIYTVTSFERNHVQAAPLMTDSTLWHRLLVHNYPAGWGRITMANEKLDYCTFIVDSLNPQVDIHPVSQSTPNLFTYELSDADNLILRGAWGQDSIVVQLKKESDKYTLLNSGFHWVNERPNN